MSVRASPVPVPDPVHTEAHDGGLPGALYLYVVISPGASTVGVRSVHRAADGVCHA